MIDTAAKRSSVLDDIGPLPGGGMAQPDRQQVGEVYRGIVVRTPQCIFGIISDFMPTGDPTKLSFTVRWGMTITVAGLSNGANNIEVNVGLNDAQITSELRARLAEILSDASGVVFLPIDVRGCSV